MNLEQLHPLVEGNSCIYIRKRTVRGKPQYELRMRFTYRSSSTLAMIQSDYTGGYLRRKNKYSSTLELTGAQALPLLSKVSPLLVKKAAQSELAIKFQQHKRKTAGGDPLEPSFLKAEEEMYQSMRRLNSGSNNSRHGVMSKKGDIGRGTHDDPSVEPFLPEANNDVVVVYKGKKKLYVDLNTRRLVEPPPE